MTFEASYFEDAAFWAHGMVEDSANLKRLQATADILPPGTASLLDVGCGNGVFARLVKTRHPDMRVACVDRSATALAHVQADDKRQCEITSLPFADRSFDCLTCLEVIEHLTCSDFDAALAELARVARRTVVISVPYDEAIEKNVDTCPQCRTIFNRDLHLRSFDRLKFDALMNRFGFRNEETTIPVMNEHFWGFPSYYALQRRLSGEPDRSTLFLSPLCPLCGYAPPRLPGAAATHSQSAPAGAAPAPAPQPSTGLKALVKRCWPKRTTPGYWILGRFVREGA